MSAIETLSNRRARRTRRKRCEGLRAHARRLQFLPQPPLPEVPGRGGAEMARRARGGTLAGPLLSRRLYFRRRRSARSRSRTRPPSTTSCSDPLPTRCSRSPPTRSYLGARIGLTAVLHTWGSALTHHPHVHAHRSWWRRVAGWVALDRLHARLLPAGARPLAPVPPPLSRTLRRAQRGRPPGLLRRSGTPLADKRAFDAALAPLRRSEWVVFTPSDPWPGRKPRSPISLKLHPPRRDLQFPAHRARPGAGVTFKWKDLPNQRPRPAQDHDAQRRRVHSPLSPPRPAERLPPHPPLRPLRRNRFEPATSSASDNCSPRPRASPERSPNAADSEAERPSPLRPCPELRRPEDHRRNIRRRARVLRARRRRAGSGSTPP